MDVYSELKQLCERYIRGDTNSRNFLEGLHWAFADDGGEDWNDDKESLVRLAQAIVKG